MIGTTQRQIGECYEDGEVQTTEDEANARRIVACVNACADISTAELTRTMPEAAQFIRDADTMKAELRSVREERDALRGQIVALQSIKQDQQTVYGTLEKALKESESEVERQRAQILDLLAGQQEQARNVIANDKNADDVNVGREWLVIESSSKNAVFAFENSFGSPNGYIPRDVAEVLLGRELGGIVWFSRRESALLRAHPEYRTDAAALALKAAQ